MPNWPVALFHAALLAKYAAALVLLMLTEYRGQLLLLLEDQVAALPCVDVPVSPVTVRVGVHCIRSGKEAAMVMEIVFFAQGSLLDWNAVGVIKAFVTCITVPLRECNLEEMWGSWSLMSL